MRRISYVALRPRLLALVVGISLVGCASVDRDMDIPMGKAYEPTNFTHEGPLPNTLKRVAVLPMHSRIWTDTEMDLLEYSMVAELGKLNRFEVVSVPRASMEEMFGVRSAGSSSALPAELFSKVRDGYDADAILMVDLTHYLPYQPLAMGVRGKLVEIPSGRVLWSFDDIFDVSQPEVAVAAREYYLDSSRQTYPLGHTSGIMQSPARFSKYVGHAMFATLPPRNP